MPEANHPESDHDLIVRMSERVAYAVTTMEQRDIYHRAEMERSNKMFLEVVASFTTTVTALQAGFSSSMSAMQTGFASKADLSTTNASVGRLERIVYGACAAVLMAFIGVLVVMVFKGGKP